MARIPLVTDVSQWGLLNWPAKSRRRLVISTLFVTALTFGFALGSAYFIMEVSASVVLNILLITTNMMLVLIAGFLQAVLLGDIFFAGPWRERVFLGQRPNDGETLDLTAVDDHSAEFIVLIIVAILVNAFAVNFITNDFFGRYHNEGFFQVQMRHEDQEQRIASLMNLADPINNRLWEREGLRALIVESFNDEDLGVRRRAIWAAGSLEILRARPRLREIVAGDDDPSLRGEAGFTLGKLGPDRASRQILEEFVGEGHPEAVRIGALRGLARMGDIGAVEAVMAQIDDENEAVMTHAFWALARIGSPVPREQIRQIIESEPDGPRRCAAMEAFKLVATAEDALWARRQFQRTPPELRCDAVTFEEPDERVHHLVWGESVRMKWLKTVGNTDPYEHENWLTLLVADPEEQDYVREVAAEILKQMDR